MTIGIFILAIIFGYIRKGKLQNLAQYEIKLVPLILLSFLIQMGIFIAYKYNIEIIQNYDILLHFVSYIILFAGLMGNFDNKWFILITLGIVMNFMVIFLNGGKMPVSYDAGAKINLDAEMMATLLSNKAGTHQALGSNALLGVLADIIPISLPGVLAFLNNIYSIGDFVMFAGMFGLIQSIMVRSSEEDEMIEPAQKEMEEKEDAFNENFKPMDPLEEMFLFEQNKIPIHGETATRVEQVSESNGQETIALNLHTSIESQNKEDQLPIGETTAFLEEDKEEKSRNLDFSKFDFGNEYSTDERNAMDEKEEEVYKNHVTSESEEFASETYSADGSDDKDHSELAEEEVDTVHQFIIVDGKIRKNPNYQLPINQDQEEQEDNVRDVNTQEDQDVEELELDHTDLYGQEEPTAENNIIQNLTDSDRIELMKKMKKRKAEGYTLVEINVGDKKINFWKKDL